MAPSLDVNDTVPVAPHALTAELPRGTAVDRYVILHQLGAGGMGVVYAAHDPELDRKIAIKLLRPRGPTDPGARARLQREAQAMARLSHPAVVPVFDVGTYRDQLFVAMELVDGRTLTAWLAAERPGWRAALAMLVRAGRGLAAAHTAGVVHRDFKPDNVLLGGDGRVCVTDFGLARVAGGPPSESAEPAGSQPDAEPTGAEPLTRSGVIMGTPAYMAPEQHLGRPADDKADQFSFCVTLYEALYGARPFVAEDADGVPSILVLAGEVTGGRVRPAPKGSGVPRWLRQAVVRGLAVAPADRWSSMDALLDSLEATPRRRRRIVGVAIAVTALAVATTLTVLDRGGRGERPVPAAAHVEHERGMQLWRGGSTAPARRAWMRALSTDPHLAPAALRLGLLSTAADESRRFLRVAMAHRERLTADEDELLDASREAMQPLPDLAVWEGELAALVARWPDAAEAHYHLARVRHQRGDVDGAAVAIAAVERDPDMAAAALALLAQIEKNRSGLVAVRRAYDDCLERSADATDCLAGKTRVLALDGQCDAMERMAQRWIATDDLDPAAYHAMAMALAAREAPLASVREVVQAKWDAQRAQGGGTENEWLDRYRLHALAGDFSAAMAEARAVRAEIPASAPLTRHSESALWLVIAAVEGGDREVAAEVSLDFVQRSRAWLPDNPREFAMPLWFLAVAAMVEAITPEEHRAERARWIELFDRSVAASGGNVDPYTHAFPWVVGYAAGIRTPEQARVAVEALPRFEPLPEAGSRESDIDLVIGQVFRLDGQLVRARPYLERAARACMILENPFSHVYAREQLGELLIATGHLEEGRRELDFVVRLWDAARPGSQYVERARAALR